MEPGHEDREYSLEASKFREQTKGLNGARS